MGGGGSGPARRAGWGLTVRLTAEPPEEVTSVRSPARSQHTACRGDLGGSPTLLTSLHQCYHSLLKAYTSFFSNQVPQTRLSRGVLLVGHARGHHSPMVREAGLCLVLVRASYLLLHLDPTGQGVVKARSYVGVGSSAPPTSRSQAESDRPVPLPVCLLLKQLRSQKEAQGPFSPTHRWEN